MERIWRGVGRWLGNRTTAAFAIIVVVTAVTLVGAGQLDFATGQDSYLQPDSQEAKDNRAYQELFGGENMVVLFTMEEGHTVADLFTPANIEQMRAVEDQLRGDPSIQNVVSPLTALQWSGDLVTSGTASQILGRAMERETDETAIAAREQDERVTLARVAAAGVPGMENPEWIKFLLFENVGFELADDGTLTAPPDPELVVRKALRAFIPDTTHALLAAILVGNAPLDQLADGSEAVAASLEGRGFENSAVIVTGTPTFLTEINEYLQGGMLLLGGIAVLVMIVVLIVAFNVRWRLLPLLGMIVGVIWGFGIFGFTGSDLSLVTIAGLPILIGMGIEFSIQLHNRVEEECVIDHEAGPFAETARALGPPLLLATIAAALAFLAMLISRVPMVQDFGVLLAIGIVALLLSGFVTMLSVLGLRERRKPTTSTAGRGWVEKTVDWLGSLPRGAVVPLILVSIVIPLVGLALEDRAKIESDPVNWANQSSTAIRNVRTLTEETGFASTLGIFIEADEEGGNGIFTDEMGAFVHDLVFASTDMHPEVLPEASSLPTTVSYLLAVPGATALPPTGLDMLQAYELAPPDIQRLLVGPEGNSTQVMYQVGDSSLETRSAVVDDIHALIADPGDAARLPANASATTGGLAIVGVGLLDNITANKAQLTLLALALVAALVVLRHRSVARALLTMIPVLLATGASATLVSLLGITLSPLTTVGGPLVVATCAEFAILLVDRYAEERQRGLTPAESQRVAADRTGRAFLTSALTTIGGFAVLMFSSLPLLRDFGAAVTLNIAVAVISALVVVPPLLAWADDRGYLRLPGTQRAPDAAPERPRLVPQLVAAGVGALLVAAAVLTVVTATDEGDAQAASVQTVPAGVPATLPPPTTAPPPTTSLAPDATLPPGEPVEPEGLVASTFYAALVGAGVDPGVARCAADNLIAKKSEEELLAMGVATSPRPPEVDAILTEAATQCGVTEEQLAAAAG